MKQKISIVLILTLLLSCSLWQRQTLAEENYRKYKVCVVNMSDASTVTASRGISESKITADGAYSVKWQKQDQTTSIQFDSALKDWSAYHILSVKIYCPVATGSFFYIRAISSVANGSYFISPKQAADWTGWKTFRLSLSDFTPARSASYETIEKIDLYATGWGISPNPDTVLYIDNLYLEDNLGDLSVYSLMAQKDCLLNLDADGTVPSSYPISNAIFRNASETVAWENQIDCTHIDFNKLELTDISDYTCISFWLYSPKATGSQCLLGLTYSGGYYSYKFDINFSGWKQMIIPVEELLNSNETGIRNITGLWLYANGWGMTPSSETKLYLDNIYAEKIVTKSGTPVPDLSCDLIRTMLDILPQFSLWHYGDAFVWKYGEKSYLPNQNIWYRKNNTIYVPASFFADTVNATVAEDSVTLDSLSVLPQKISALGQEWIELEQTAKALGLTTEIRDSFVFIGQEAVIQIAQMPEMNAMLRFLSKTELTGSDCTDADFSALIDCWQNFLTGNNSSDELADIASKKASVSYYAKAYSDSMGTPNAQASSSTGSYVLGYWNKAVISTADMRVQYMYLYQMALGYATKGSAVYHDTVVKDKILKALDWLYENLYGIDEMNNTGWRDTSLFNWYEWTIGVPEDLSKTLLLMWEELPVEKMNAYLSVLDFFTKYKGAKGANLIKIVYPKMISALLRKDGQTFIALKDYIQKDMAYQSDYSGEGIHPDGSYRYHYYYAMNGSYGNAYIETLSDIACILSGSKFSLSGYEAENYIAWLEKGYLPIIYDGRLMTAFCGRSLGGEASRATTVVNGVLKLSELMDYDTKDKMLKFCKKCYDSGNLTLSAMSYSSIEKMYALNQQSFITKENPIFNVYSNTDKAAWNTERFALGFSMSSSRTSGWESINNENKRGWYQGDGAVYLYTKDKRNFDTAYWNYADPYMVPGTTADSQLREAISIKDSEVYKSSKSFVGGVSLSGKYGALAMELESCHTETDNGIVTDYGNSLPLHANDLVAKKAWFVFDNEVVALGSGISSTVQSDVKTIADNRIMDSDRIDTAGGSLLLAKNTEQTIASPWVHLGESGYIFADGQNVKALRETNGGYYFNKLWLDHGENPSNGKYAYTLLPQISAEQTREYCENPDAVILSNTESVQAVYDHSTQITSYVFWNAGFFNNLSVSAPCIVSVKKRGDGIELAVADPTQKLANVEITLNESYAAVSSSRVCLKDSNTVCFDLSGTEGTTVETVLQAVPDFEMELAEKEQKTYCHIINHTLRDTDAVLLCVTFAENHDTLLDIQKTDIRIPATGCNILAEQMTGTMIYLLDNLSALKPLAKPIQYK